MSRYRESTSHTEKFFAPPVSAAKPAPVQPNPEVKVTDRYPVKVLYGPKGDVIARHDPSPPIGFCVPSPPQP